MLRFAQIARELAKEIVAMVVQKAVVLHVQTIVKVHALVRVKPFVQRHA